MKRTDPATDLAERSIRQWQLSESKAARHDLAKETQVLTSQVRSTGDISTFTVGSIAGFLGALACLLAMQHCWSFNVGSRTSPPAPNLCNYS